MNGSDIKALAQRAAGLEDRSTERVLELHDRIAVARRRHRTATVSGVAAVVLVMAGLTAVSVGRDTHDVQPAPPPAPGAAPGRGTCWVLPVESVGDLNYWYDDSPRVDCSEEHVTETVLSFPLEEATPEAAQAYFDRCQDAVRNYIGVDWASWIPWAGILLLPSEEQVAHGASWVRCDAAFPSTWAFDAARSTSVSALGLADDPPLDFWACLNQPVEVEDQPFVPCDRPHMYEQTGSVAVIRGSGEYPTEADRDQALASQCGRAVPAHLNGASVTGAWPSRARFEPYAEFSAACFAFDPDGQPLPAR